jgi:hypothetical protein
MKPLFKIGDTVTVTFLGSDRICKIIDINTHPVHSDRLIYKAKDIHTNTIIPYIGINGSEKFANIAV